MQFWSWLSQNYNDVKSIRISENHVADSAIAINAWKEYVENFNQSGKGVAHFYYDEHHTTPSRNRVRVHIILHPRTVN